jgi:hypothetical protein
LAETVPSAPSPKNTRGRRRRLEIERAGRRQRAVPLTSSLMPMVNRRRGRRRRQLVEHRLGTIAGVNSFDARP